MSPNNMKRFSILWTVLFLAVEAFAQVWVNTNIPGTMGPVPGAQTNPIAPAPGMIWVSSSMSMRSNFYLHDSATPLHERIQFNEDLQDSIAAVGAVASNALPKASTNGWEIGSHAGLVKTGHVGNVNISGIFTLNNTHPEYVLPEGGISESHSISFITYYEVDGTKLITNSLHSGKANIESSITNLYWNNCRVFTEADGMFWTNNALYSPSFKRIKSDSTNDVAVSVTIDGTTYEADGDGDINLGTIEGGTGISASTATGIAQTVVAAATTNSMTNINWSALGGASPSPNKSLGASAVGWPILNTNNAPFVTILTDTNMGTLLNFPLDVGGMVDSLPIVSDTSASITQLVFVARAYAAAGSEWGTVGLITTFGGSILTNIVTLTNAPTTQTVTLAHAPVSGPCVVPFSWGIVSTSTVGTAVGNARFSVMQARGSW